MTDGRLAEIREALGKSDAEFIAAAPGYVRELLEVVEWLRSEHEKDAEALRAAALLTAVLMDVDFDKVVREFEDSQRGESRLSASARRRKERKLAQRIRKD